MIYAQANDHRILPRELAALNADEDQKVATFRQWFIETSWNQTTFDVTQHRAAGSNWYVLPKGILDYASPPRLNRWKVVTQPRLGSQADAASICHRRRVAQRY